jgi:hypothetical protein
MSALGQKQTSHRLRVMSALPPKADIAGRQLDVRFVPIADAPPLEGAQPRGLLRQASLFKSCKDRTCHFGGACGNLK